MQCWNVSIRTELASQSATEQVGEEAAEHGRGTQDTSTFPEVIDTQVELPFSGKGAPETSHVYVPKSTVDRFLALVWQSGRFVFVFVFLFW